MQAAQTGQYFQSCTTSVRKYFLCVSKIAEDEIICCFTMPLQGFLLASWCYIANILYFYLKLGVMFYYCQVPLSYHGINLR